MLPPRATKRPARTTAVKLSRPAPTPCAPPTPRYATREEAKAAIGALNGTSTLPGADRPLLVKFANSPKPRRRDLDGMGDGSPGHVHSSHGGPSLPPRGSAPEPYGGDGHKLFVGMVPFNSSERRGWGQGRGGRGARDLAGLAGLRADRPGRKAA